jgi:hypothetical protein
MLQRVVVVFEKCLFPLGHGVFTRSARVLKLARA